MSALERKFIGQLFFKIAEVLDIKNEDAVCTIEFYNRRTPFDTEGTFSLVDTNPYRIKLASVVNERPTILSRRHGSHLEMMGWCLAHEMIHLKQRLRDGLERFTGDENESGYVMFKGERFGAEQLRDLALRHLPFEKKVCLNGQGV